MSRKSSGSVYDNFPCVRVGDYDLPSSMDLRQYLDEMQEVGQWEDDIDLPTIPDDEVVNPTPTPLSCFHNLPLPDWFTVLVKQPDLFACAHAATSCNEVAIPALALLLHLSAGLLSLSVCLE